MAGFFGLFNYAKEGPGIEKDAPKKKTFVVFFETFFRNFWKFIPISFVYCLISLPVLTSGLAAAGLTNVTRNIARDKHSFGLSDFFDTIKSNWKQALPAGIINLAIYAVLAFDLYFFYFSLNGMVSAVFLGIGISIFYVFTVMTFYIWTLIITFNFKLSEVYKNSFKFVFINFKMNFLCFLMITAIYALFLVVGYFVGNFAVTLIEFALFVFCFPAFRYLIIQYCIFPSVKKYIIDPYYKEHPYEDIEKRRNLGIETELPEEDGEENEYSAEENAE